MEKVTTVIVPERLVGNTDVALQRAGADHCELFVLWTGTVKGPSFQVHNLHVPDQKSYRNEDGLSVVVEGPELHRLNVWLFEHHQLVGVQIHAHPANAYHSDTDNTFPIATTLGAFSIVVPNFARRGLLDAGTEIFRLRAEGWIREKVSSKEVVRTC